MTLPDGVSAYSWMCHNGYNECLYNLLLQGQRICSDNEAGRNPVVNLANLGEYDEGDLEWSDTG